MLQESWVLKISGNRFQQSVNKDMANFRHYNQGLMMSDEFTFCEAKNVASIVTFET